MILTYASTIIVQASMNKCCNNHADAAFLEHSEVFDDVREIKTP